MLILIIYNKDEKLFKVKLNTEFYCTYYLKNRKIEITKFIK